MVSCSQPMNAVSTPTSGHTPFPGGGSGGGPWSADPPSPHQEAAAAQLRPQSGGGTTLRGHHPPLLNHGPGHSLPPPDFLPPPGSILRPMGGPPLRGAPFFIREIYKNGFLKRLPYNEKKSSALAKLMKTDRFWVVFSIHDDIHPFLELWHEPTEVANRPPQHIFPLAACQHISTSIVPAGDSEWSFVINFDSAVAIRFSCNSREVMDDWVEVIRAKLAEMGILNPKGNLYSRTPLGPPVTKPVIRDPTSPLPQPPPPPPPPLQPPSAASEPSAGAASFAATASADASETLTVMLPRKQVDETSPNSSNHQVATPTGTTTTTTTRTKAVIGTVAGNPSSSFTTSIYLNRSSSGDPTAANNSSAADHLVVGRKTSLPPPPSSLTNSAAAAGGAHKTKTNRAAAKSLSSLSQSSLVDVKISSSSAPLDFSKGGEGSGGVGGGATSSVYLNQSSPTRHVTVIPVNSGEGAAAGGDEEEVEQQLKETNGWTDEPSLDHATASSSAHLESVENHTYGAIFHFDEGVVNNSSSSKMSGGARGREKGKKGSGGTGAELKSPSRRQQQQAAPTATEKTSPSRRGRERTSRTSAVNAGAADNDPPPLPERPVALFRRLSERRHEAGPPAESSRPHPLSGAASNNAHSSNNNNSNNNHSNNHNKGNKIRRKSRRSSSLGPFLDRASSQPIGGDGGVGASTLSLESVDSNPRQAVPRAEGRYLGGAVPRRPLLHSAAYSRPVDAAAGLPGPHEPGVAAGHLLSSPSRALNELGGVPGLRPPFYHHPLGAAHSGAAPSPATAAGTAFPPMVPLPGLTCQLSIPPGGFRTLLHFISEVLFGSSLEPRIN
jgi:hypothetical protein